VAPTAPRVLDSAPIAAALIATAVLGLYLRLMRQESDRPVAWFLGGLVVSILLCGYASVRLALRRTALITAGMIMIILGMLGILSIGLPILVAGIVAMLSALRRTESSADADRSVG
jgi:membrane-bound ClpP family serine protease